VIKLTYVNIVGLISNDEEFLEVENVATVFIIEERMLNITHNLKRDNAAKEMLICKNIIPKKSVLLED